MRILLAATLLALPALAPAAAAPEGTGVGSRVPRFTAQLLDPGSKPGRALDSQSTERVTVYVFLGTTCPATSAYLGRLGELEKAYGGKGVDFVYLYPNRTDTLAAKKSFHGTSGLRGSLVDDEGARIARTLGATKTTEVVLVGRDGTIVYRGAVDDAREASAVKVRLLRAALDEHLAGKPVSVTTSTVFA